jgi:hypothetical protein
MQNQFDDVDFRATQGMNRGGQDGMQIGPSRTLPVEDIEKSMKRDKVLQDMFNSTVLAGPRAKQRVDAWGGADVHRNKDGSYRLYWHTEQNTDQSGNLPQFGNPREGGVHSGTNQAAEQASFGLINHQDDLDSMIEGRAALEENLRQVFGLADMDVQKGMNTVGKTMRQYIARKFNDQSWMPTGANFDSLFNDLKAQLGEALKRLDADPNAASRYMGKLKDVDTPSTVPHLFKGKNGFYWHDGGGYSVESFNAKLQETWPDEADKIQRLYEDSTRNIAPLTDDAEMWGLNQAATTAEWKALQGFLESKGFDHAWYINAVEDKGSVSIINWNPDLWMPVYEIAGNNRQQTAALQMLAAMGLPIGATGAALRETE